MIDNYQFLNPSPKQNVTVPESLTGASRVPFLQNKNKQSFTGLFFFCAVAFAGEVWYNNNNRTGGLEG